MLHIERATAHLVALLLFTGIAASGLGPFKRVAKQQVLIDQHRQRVLIRLDARMLALRIIQGQEHRGKHFRRDVIGRAQNVRREDATDHQRIDVNDDRLARGRVHKHVVAGKVRVRQPSLVQPAHRARQAHGQGEIADPGAAFLLRNHRAKPRAGEPAALFLLAFPRSGAKQKLPGIRRANHTQPG